MRQLEADATSFWPGSYEPRRRDLHGVTTEVWAAAERRERADTNGHGITESELLSLTAQIDRSARRFAA